MKDIDQRRLGKVKASQLHVSPATPLVVLAMLILLIGAGCSCSEDAPPRGRIGAMPFPGWFTLYSTVGVDDLGRHRYRNCVRLFQEDEKERGIMYTTRAGFLDLAHIRVAIDRTRYCVRQIRRGMEEDQAELTLSGPNFSDWHVALNYPPDWNDLPPDERASAIDELSMRAGQQLAYQMLVWHEVITWFGYSSSIVFTEAPSAFSYEDTMSHIVGLQVAEQAMRDSDRSFDDAVTAALAATLAELGAVSRPETDQAARSVEGIWWANERPLKRHLDLGMWGEPVYPWLVTDVPFATGAEPQPFYLPELTNVCGRDMRDFYSVQISPNIWQTGRMRAYLPDQPERFSGDRDLSILLQVVRSQMEEEFGEGVSRPWPDETAPSNEVAVHSERVRSAAAACSSSAPEVPRSSADLPRP